MIDALLSLFTGSGGVFAILGAILAAVAAAYFKGRGDGKAKGENTALKKQVAAQDERLEMNREATKAEREAAGMTDDEARKEALKWAKPR